MNILIFGATGATGHELIQQALELGHRITAFGRRPEKLRIKNNALKLFQGDVSDYTSVSKAVRNQDAVLSALGAKSPFKHDVALIEGVRNIVKSMEISGCRRMVYLSFAGVNEAKQQFSFFFRSILSNLLAQATRDHEIKETIIKESALAWTIIRPPKLSNGPHTGNFRTGENIRPKGIMPVVSRADVADFMLQQLDETSYIRRAALILP